MDKSQFPDNTKWDFIALGYNLRDIEELLERMILRTPSGEARNKLTELNIHVMQALKIYES